MHLPAPLDRAPLALTEGAIIECLRRDPEVTLHPGLANAALLYDDAGREKLAAVYRGYVAAIRETGLPLLLCAPTWRANRERLQASALGGRDVNGDAVRFLREIREEAGDYRRMIVVGGLMACRGDCYLPEQGLDPDAAHAFHAWQARRLADAGADLIMAATLPAAPEAQGLARAMADTGVPYIVSFVLRPNGCLLDGTPLEEAMDRVESAVSEPPAAFMANCTHHSTLRQGLTARPQAKGLIGLQANASARSPEELDGSAELDAEPPEAFAQGMMGLARDFGLRILGGCCGTDQHHIAALARLAAG